jgi:hypothetical protein
MMFFVVVLAGRPWRVLSLTLKFSNPPKNRSVRHFTLPIIVAHLSVNIYRLYDHSELPRLFSIITSETIRIESSSTTWFQM